MHLDLEALKTLLPLIIIQIILIVVATIDLFKNHKKPIELLWLPVIIFGTLLGSIAYFIFGRQRL
ncbi:PLD nuclease N-terminal domain-containing protein [Xylocopilactobacillus apis]|uniref:Cardiolipin synthase N-terminal domain-containing protein n=1 Tax=Xylocopilactobacillus apis TaxID=2932183 RepID=A0AAU9CV71_9LACO|nr:hypothetical protein KIMC2_08480 [Xylocopilactobacillus apis]